MKHLFGTYWTLGLLLPILVAGATQVEAKLDHREFTIEGHVAFIIGSSKPSSGRTPWVLYAPTLGDELPGDAENWMFRQFVEAGIHIAGVDVGESYGSPDGRAVYTALHRHLTSKEGFAYKACLLARSRGGLMLYSWAMENPDKVSGIGGIYPVCNLTSYPGIKRACSAYGMTEAALSETLDEHNPINRLAPLAKAGIPIYHIHGDDDVVVPLEDNSGLLYERYGKLGGKMQLQVARGQGHNMWEGFFHCQGLVDFVINSAKRATRPFLVFLLGGQSNMDGCGRGEELPEAFEDHPDNVVIWDNRSKAWAALEKDSFATSRKQMFGPEMAFGHRLAQAYPNHNIAMVKTSAGGTKLHTQWTPGKVMYQRFTSNYENALEQLKEAGSDYVIAGMLWMQGESDSETLEMANAYEDNLKSLISDVRRRTGNDRLPFVMGRISSSLLKKTPWNFDHTRIVQRAQEVVATQDVHVHIINTDGLSTLQDNTHFDTTAQLKLGDDMARIMIRELRKNRGKFNRTSEEDVVLNVNWMDLLSGHDMVWMKLP